MAERVVSGAAEHGASLAVIVLVAHETVRELELGSAHAVEVLSPVLTHSQMTLRGHGTDDALWVFCKQSTSQSLVLCYSN